MRTEAQILKRIMKLKEAVQKFDTWGMDGYQEGMEARAEIRQLEWVIAKHEED